MKTKIVKELDIQNLHDLKDLMSTAEGRRFFSWLMLKCGLNNPSFTGSESTTYFNEGQRNIALVLQGRMRALDIEGVSLMHQAEQEYIMLQRGIESKIKSEVEGNNGKSHLF